MSDQDTKKDSTGNESGKKFRLPSMNQNAPSEASKDPLNILKEIAKDKEIDPETKEWLFNYAVTRFTNRRKMAYLSLITIIAFVGFLASIVATYYGVSSFRPSS